MPSDTETPMSWWPPSTDQPLDFSTKARVRVYQPAQISPPTPKFHRFDNHASSTTSEQTPLSMGFHRPMSNSPPPPPPPLPLHPYNIMDPGMLNEMFRPGLLGGLPSLNSLPNIPIPYIDNRRPTTKNMRPFKAYPRDPLTLPLGYCGLTSPLMPMELQKGLLLNEGYADFRKNLLLSSQPSPVQVCVDDKSQSQEAEDNNDQNKVKDDSSNLASPDSPPSSSNSGQFSSSSKRKPRTLPEELKDEAYWERRRKNNEAAKRSRDARRAKEDEIAIRAAYLEQENLKLRVEVASLKNETAKLKCMLYNS